MGRRLVLAEVEYQNNLLKADGFGSLPLVFLLQQEIQM